MLEPPDIQAEIIIVCLRQAYGLHTEQVEFLPLGADREQALHYLASNFLPGGVLEIALQTEQALEEQPGRRNGHLPPTLQK
jgi:hypothetical protein